MYTNIYSLFFSSMLFKYLEANLNSMKNFFVELYVVFHVYNTIQNIMSFIELH